MYIITVSRMTSGELLKQRKGLRIARSYGTTPARLKLICSDNTLGRHSGAAVAGIKHIADRIAQHIEGKHQ